MHVTKITNMCEDSYRVFTVSAGHAMPIRSLTFSPDSQLLVTASDDGYIKIYDVWVWELLPDSSFNSVDDMSSLILKDMELKLALLLNSKVMV